jgi:hypothetical protein
MAVSPARRVAALVAVLAGTWTLAACSTTSPKATHTAVRPVREAPTRTSYAVEGGRTLHMACQGRGRVPVIFLAGANDPAVVWDQVVRLLGPDVLACGFDHAGVALSSPPATTPTTPAANAADLEAVLKQTGLGHRYVLVAHSLGGVTAVVFGGTYRNQIAGAVLIDPTVPSFLKLPRLRDLGLDPDTSTHQVERITGWPNVPLEVLSHDPDKAVASGAFSADLQQQWTAGQQAYSHLSSQGGQQSVPGAGHYVFADNPQIVVTTIQHVLQNAQHTHRRHQ